MNTPSPRQPNNLPSLNAAPQISADELQMRNWLRLRRELSELHARLEYLKLMISLGVGK